MSTPRKKVFGYGATESKTQWKRYGQFRNPSLERGDEGLRSYGLLFAGAVALDPFAITVTVAVPDVGSDEAAAARADEFFLDTMAGHSLID